jgi:hypothetical protein
MAVTTATHTAAPTGLLDLPDALLERILIAASNGGQWRGLRKARRACSRLRAVAYAAVQKAAWQVQFWDDALAPRALLPRLSALKRLHLQLYFADGYELGTDEYSEEAELLGIEPVCEADKMDFVCHQATDIMEAVRE